MNFSETDILNNLLDGVLIESVDGKLVYYNDQFTQLLHLPRPELGTSFENYLAAVLALKFSNPAAFIEFLEVVKARPAVKHQFDVQMHSQSKTQTEALTEIEIQIFNLAKNNIAGGKIWFFYDRSHIKSIERQLSDQKKMMTYSASMSALGEMAGGIAHEINNPLSIIHAHAEMLAEVLDENLTLQLVNRAGSKIRDTAQRIAKIINGLRVFSRKGDKDPLQTLALSTVLEDTLAICIEKFKSRSVVIYVDELNHDIQVNARATQLMQVFLNLLNNAADAVVPLTEKWIKIKLTSNNEFAEIKIIDSGLGIDSLIFSKVFDPFFTTKPLGQGTGLGLSISKSIIDDHKGFLFIDDKSKNTCFTVQLPSVKKSNEELS